MSQLRTYRSRARLVELDEDSENIAVRGNVQGEEIPESADQRPFKQAGWRFMRRSSRPVGGDPRTDYARILRRRRDGRLTLNLNRAIVKFSEQADDATIARSLESVGGRILKRVPLASNVFSVEFRPDRDVFDALDALSNLDHVDFAEPELVEALGAR